MTKKRKVEPKRVVTRRQLSRWQQEKQRQRIIMSLGIAAIVLILGVLSYGYYDTEVKPFRQPAVRVNDTVFDMGYYLKVLRYYGLGQNPFQLSELADQVVATIQNDELLRQSAQGLGVHVTTAEVDQELRDLILSSSVNSGEMDEAEFEQLYEEWLDGVQFSDKEYRMIVETDLLRWKLREKIGEGVPKVGQQVYAQAILLGSEEDAEEAVARLEAGEDFASVAREVSQDSSSREEGGDLGWLPRGIRSSVFDEVAFSLEPGDLSEPIYDETVTTKGGYWLIRVLERSEEKANIQAILLGTEEEAEKVAARLEAGEDFASVAREVSQDPVTKERGGELGWLAQGGMSPGFDEVAFSLELGVLSEPVYDERVITEGGYWLIRVVENDDNREIEDNIREVLKGKAFNDWFSKERGRSRLESYLDEDKKVWAIGQVLGY